MNEHSCYPVSIDTTHKAPFHRGGANRFWEAIFLWLTLILKSIQMLDYIQRNIQEMEHSPNCMLSPVTDQHVPVRKGQTTDQKTHISWQENEQNRI